MPGPVLPSNVCNQCGLSHPPIPENSRCPMAKHSTVTGEDIDYGNFLSSIQNIVSSQIDVKKIKHPKKMFASLIVEFMKMVENYSESNEKTK